MKLKEYTPIIVQTIIAVSVMLALLTFFHNL